MLLVRRLGNHVLWGLLKNAGSLLGANVAASAMSALALVIAARNLRPADFGAFATITALIFVVDSLVNFQSWQAVIKYGSERLAKDDRHGLRALLKTTATVDVVCALLACGAAIVVAFSLQQVFSWNDSTAELAAWFSLVIITRTTGTATGVLRLLDRFDVLAVQQAMVGALRLGFVFAAATLGANLGGFLLAWGASEAAGNVVLIVVARQECARRRLLAGGECTGSQSLQPTLWSFLWTTNLHGSLKTAIRELDVLVLAALSGNTSAGLYKIAKQVGAVAGKAVGPLYQAIYPELAKAVAANDRERFVLTLKKPTLWASTAFGGLVLLFAVAGYPALTWVLGNGYAAAFLPSLIYLAGAFLSAATFALHPAMLALGHPQSSFRVLLASTAVYAALFPLMVVEFDVVGAAASFVLFYVVWSTLMLRLLLFKLAAYEWAPCKTT